MSGYSTATFLDHAAIAALNALVSSATPVDDAEKIAQRAWCFAKALTEQRIKENVPRGHLINHASEVARRKD